MTESATKPDAAAAVQIAGSASAPFVFFDIVSAQGVEAGVVIIELVARTIVATGGSEIRNEIVATGHLRTSIQGARSLKNAIDDVLLLLAPVEKPEGPAN